MHLLWEILRRSMYTSPAVTKRNSVERTRARRSNLVWARSQQECGVSIRKLLEDRHHKNNAFEVIDCKNAHKRSIIGTPFRRLTFFLTETVKHLGP